MRSPSGPAPRRIFYGWYVVYAAGLIMATTSGLGFYLLPVLLDAFIAQRQFAVTAASNGTAVFFVAASISGVVAGQLVDRFDPRYVMAGSGIATSLALLSIGAISEPWQLFVFYAVFGLAYGGCSLVPTTTLVARWFEQRRPLALSIASTGLSLGGAFLTPLAALLVLKLGLDGAAPWIALGFFLGVVPVTVWIVRASPHDMGLAPDGAAHDESAGPRPVPHHIPLAEVWRSRFFIASTAAFLFALGSQMGGVAHLFRLANTRVDAETATAAIALFAATSLVGRLVTGWLLIRVGSRAMTLAIMAVQVFTLALLAWAHGASSVLVATALFGLNAGNTLMMQPLLLAEAFGVRDYGRIYSVSQLIGVSGFALGPALIGLLYEASGGYTVAYLAMALASLVGMAAFALAGPTRKPRPAA